MTDAMGWQTRYTYTDNNLIATVVRYDPATNTSFTIESFKYDGAGNPVESLTNHGTTKTTVALDPAGRVTTQTLDPAGVNRTTNYVYDVRDYVVSYRISDAAGASQRVDRMHDGGGALVGETMYPTTPNPAEPVPVGRWGLNETTGTTADDSVGNSPATLSGGLSWSTDHGGSLASDGASGSAACASGPVVDTASSFTVAAWVKLSSLPTSNKYAVSQDGTRRSGFLLGYNSANNRWRMMMATPNSDTASQSEESTTAASLDTWTHLVGVYDQQAEKLRLYVNGVLEDEGNKTSLWEGATGSLCLGRAKWTGNPGFWWPGSIDDVQVYQEVLSATQIAEIHAGTAPAADARVLRTSWTVDQRGLATSQVDGDGDVTYFDYDEAGRLAVTTFPPVHTEPGDGSAPVFAPVVESAAYNTFGEVVESRDGNGNHTFAEFDAAGQLSEVWLPAYTPPGSSTPITPVRKTFYDDMGRPIEARDGLNNPTYAQYDQLGRVVGMQAADGGDTVATYSLTGQVLSVTDPTGARTEATYDFLGRPLTQTQVVSQTSQAHTTTFAYHPQGWLVSTTAPGRAPTSYTYNSVGEVVRAPTERATWPCSAMTSPAGGSAPSSSTSPASPPAPTARPG